MYSDRLSKGSTVDKFDYFVSRKEAWLVEDTISFKFGETNFCINIIFDNYSGNRINCQITASDLKKCFKSSFSDPLNGQPLDKVHPDNIPNISLPTYQFLLHFYNSLKTNIDKGIKEGDIIILEKPITVHAQTSSDRTDYEWGGTQYGETSVFTITSYQVKYIFDRNKYFI